MKIIVNANCALESIIYLSIFLEKNKKDRDF